MCVFFHYKALNLYVCRQMYTHGLKDISLHCAKLVEINGPICQAHHYSVAAKGARTERH